MSNSTKRATRATVQIGDIPIDVYQLPDGSYRLGGRQVTDAVKEDSKSLPRFYGVKTLKALPGADGSLRQVRADSGETFIPVAIEDAVGFWAGMMTSKGNIDAQALIVALATETLERRADRAFGVKRQEEEYDAALALRVKRIRHRRLWTDVIKDSQEKQGIYRTRQGQRQFAALTIKVNRKLFGVDDFDHNRDNMTPDQQERIEGFEFMLSARYDSIGGTVDMAALIDECFEFTPTLGA